MVFCKIYLSGSRAKYAAENAVGRERLIIRNNDVSYATSRAPVLTEALSSPTFIIPAGICRRARARERGSPPPLFLLLPSLSFYCPQSFQKSFVPLETGSSACSANFTGNIIGQERSVVPSTRLFNILRTVFSLQWLPCLFPPPFELLLSSFSLSLSFSVYSSVFFSLILSFFRLIVPIPILSITFLRRPEACERSLLLRFYSGIK